jgi:CRP-like cAMP-binding protein
MPAQSPLRNRLLSALAVADRSGLESYLERVELARGRVLHAAGERIDLIWLPETMVVSLRVGLAGGAAVEVGTVGCEGFIGHAVLLGDRTTTIESVVQVPGSGLSLPVDAFQAVLNTSSDFHQLAGRSTRAFFLQVALVAACNRLHRAEQRIARWLLMTQDRVGADELLLTHEFLAEMLGATRSTATLALGTLQRAHLVHTAWGRITILNRAGLEAASCECYAATRAEYERLLGADSCVTAPHARVAPSGRARAPGA